MARGGRGEEEEEEGDFVIFDPLKWKPRSHPFPPMQGPREEEGNLIRPQCGGRNSRNEKGEKERILSPTVYVPSSAVFHFRFLGEAAVYRKIIGRTSWQREKKSFRFFFREYVYYSLANFRRM